MTIPRIIWAKKTPKEKRTKNNKKNNNKKEGSSERVGAQAAPRPSPHKRVLFVWVEWLANRRLSTRVLLATHSSVSPLELPFRFRPSMSASSASSDTLEFEAMALASVRNGTYDFDKAYLPLMRHVQANPALLTAVDGSAASHIAVVTVVLLDALCRFDTGRNEFSSLTCFLSDAQVAACGDRMDALLQYDDWIERGQFGAFWSTWAAHRAAKLWTEAEMLPMEDRLRRAMLTTFSRTFQTVKLGTLARALNLPDIAKALATLMPLAQVKEGTVYFPANNMNTPPPVAAPRIVTSADIASAVLAVA